MATPCFLRKQDAGTAIRFDAGGKARHDKMVELAERMLDLSAGSGQALHKQLPKAKTPHEPRSL